MELKELIFLVKFDHKEPERSVAFLEIYNQRIKQFTRLIKSVSIPTYTNLDKRQIVYIALYNAIIDFKFDRDFFGFAFNHCRYDLISLQRFWWKRHRQLITNILAMDNSYIPEVLERLPIKEIMIKSNMSYREQKAFMDYIMNDYASVDETTSRAKKKVRKYFLTKRIMATYLGI